eukprot:jgi/Botrbrau1/10489/Bobra.0133s0092.1
MGETAGSRTNANTEPASPGKCKTCAGILYFSNALNDRNAYPRCVGLRNRNPQECPDLPPVQVPGAHFKYFCVGYSMYDEEQIKQNRKDRSSAADPVDLPHCEGLEIISAAHVQQSPVLSTVGPAGLESGAGSESPSPPAQGIVKGRNYGGMPASRTEIDLTDFPQRFVKSSQRVLERMAANAQALQAALISTWKKVNGRDRSDS